LVSFLFPQSVQQIGLSEIEAVGGQAFKVSQGELTDIVLIKATNQVETVKLKSDFAWSWARFKEPGTLPQELIMIEGSALECGGQELVKLGGVESYAWAKSVGDVLVLETS
jgi:hypothetical protein